MVPDIKKYIISKGKIGTKGLELVSVTGPKGFQVQAMDKGGNTRKEKQSRSYFWLHWEKTTDKELLLREE